MVRPMAMISPTMPSIRSVLLILGGLKVAGGILGHGDVGGHPAGDGIAATGNPGRDYARPAGRNPGSRSDQEAQDRGPARRPALRPHPRHLGRRRLRRPDHPSRGRESVRRSAGVARPPPALPALTLAGAMRLSGPHEQRGVSYKGCFGSIRGRFLVIFFAYRTSG
jgi:hypothetical protein